MKRCARTRSAWVRNSVGLLIFICGVSSNQAAIRTWSGAGPDAQWKNPLNWDGGLTFPTAGDSLLFSGSLGLLNTNDFANGTLFGDISFDAGAGLFTLSGNSITLGGNLINNAATASTVETISLPINLNGNRVISASAGGNAGNTVTPANLTISGVISGTGFGLTLINSNLNKLETSAGAAPFGVGTFSLGNVTLTAANTYTGPTVVQASRLTLDFSATGAPTDNIISSSSALTLGSTGLPTATPGIGALTVIGGGFTNSQSFTGTTVGNGTNQITVTTGATTNLNLGALSRAAGTHGTVNIGLPLSGTISASATLDHGILGGWATTGADYATISGGAIQAYSGYAAATGGQTVANPAFATDANVKWTGIAAGATIGAAATTTDLNSIIFADNTAVTISNPGTLRLGAHGGIYRPGAGTNNVQINTGTITAGGGPGTPGEIVFNANQTGTNNSNDLTIGAIIADNGDATSPVTVVKTGPGSLVLNGVNTFSGDTYVLQGRVQQGNASSFGTGKVYVMPGGHAFLNNTTVNNEFYIAGMGSHENQGDFGPIRVNNNITLAGKVTLIGDARVASGGANGTITGQITGNYNIEFGGVSTFGLTISNTANNWGGSTTINRGLLTLGASDVIPDTSNVTVTTVGDSGTATSTWNLNGKNETIGGLSSGGIVTGDFVQTNTGASTLTVGTGDATATFAGVLRNNGGTLAFTKVGAGTQALSGLNTYTGATSVQNGTLRQSALGALPAASTLTLGSGTTFGTLDLGGFDATVAGLATSGTATTNIIGNSGSTPVTLTVANGTGTFGGRIQDTLPGGSSTTALAMTLGSLTLSGNNTFTGGANLNGGTLIVTGALANANITTVGATATLAGSGNGTTTGLAGIVSVNGGTVQPGITVGDIAKLTTQSLNFHSGTYAVDVGSLFTADLLNDKGALTIGDSSSSLLSLSVAGSPSIGSYEVIDYAAGSLTKNADFAISGPVGFNYSLDYNTAGKVFLKVTAATNILTWNGAADQTSWDFSHANFTNGTSNVAYSNSSPAVFNDTAPANATTINIPGTVTPSTTSVNSSTRNYTFQGVGAIGGTGNLVKDGSSTLMILNNNTYSGTTTINSGAIRVGNGGATGSLGTGAIINNGTLTYNRSGTVTLDNSISGTGNLTQMGPGTLILTATNNAYNTTTISGGTLQVGNGGAAGTVGSGTVSGSAGANLAFSRSDTFSFANTIDGGIGVVMMGTGTVALSGNNTFTGGVTINSGALQVASAGALNTTTPQAISFGPGADANAKLQVNGFNTAIGGLNTNVATPGSPVVENGGGNPAVLTVISAGHSTFAGTLQNGGTSSLALNVSGGGILTLAGTYSLTTMATIDTGSTVEAGPATAFLGTTGSVYFNVGTLHVTDPGGDHNVTAGTFAPKFTTNGAPNSSAASTGTINIDPGVTLVVPGTGFRTNGGGNPHGGVFHKTGQGTLQVNGGSGQQDDPFHLDEGTIDLHAANGLGGNDNVPVLMAPGTTLIFSQDSGTNFQTPISLASAGSYNVLSNVVSVGSGGAIHTVNQVTAGPQPLATNGAFTLHVAPGANVGSGTAGLTFAGGVTLTGDGTFDVVNGVAGVTTQMTVNGPVTGATFGITKFGNGTLTLSGINTYTGPTAVRGGILAMGTADAIVTSPQLVLGGGTFATGGFNQTMTSTLLNVSAASAIDLVGSGTLKFAESSSLSSSWNGTVSILHWSGTPGTAGGSVSDPVFVGSSSNGLTVAQRSQIHFGRDANGTAYEGVDILSTGEIVPDHLSTRKLGDFNLVGGVTAADIPVMLSALADLNAYKTARSLSNDDVLNIGDLDGDGFVTNADLQGLITYLIAGHGGATAVPEPTSIMLLCMGALGLVVARRFSRRPLAC